MSTFRENSSKNLQTICCVWILPGRSWPEGPNLVKKLELRCIDLQPLLNCIRLKNVFGKWRPANGKAKAADQRNFRSSVRCSTSQTQEPSIPGP